MKKINISKAKLMNETLSFFSGIDGPGFNPFKDEWQLLNDDDTIHKDSDRFVESVKQLYHSRKTILTILDQLKK